MEERLLRLHLAYVSSLKLYRQASTSPVVEMS